MAYKSPHNLIQAYLSTFILNFFSGCLLLQALLAFRSFTRPGMLFPLFLVFLATLGLHLIDILNQRVFSAHSICSRYLLP